MATLYKYAFDNRLVVFWGAFGVRPAKDGVTITDDGRLRATFGLLKLETPLDNVDGAHITRNYRWWTAAGARSSLRDDGLTFGTNANAGVCVHFREKVPSPLRRTGHSALTVTVEDLEGLTEALARPDAARPLDVLPGGRDLTSTGGDPKGTALDATRRPVRAARSISSAAGARRNGAKSTARARKPTASRDPKLIRAWAIDHGIVVPARGRIPAHVEQQYNDAQKRP
jgi:hypothetical protein